MHRMTNTSFNTLLGLFQHYGLSQTRGMSAMVSGPMPALVIKQEHLQRISWVLALQSDKLRYSN